MPGPTPAPTRPPATLPILERRREIEEAIARHQVVVVCGQTGSGKTTQLPQFCLDMGLAERGVIGHTQPRRLAARAVAARIAEERGERLGGLVGVKVRFEDQTSRATRIKVMTDGTLLAELAGDPALCAYSVIILDEAHERSLNIDFLLGCLRRLLPSRPDLKLIITSATIDPARFSQAFGGPARAPVIEVSGRVYPVEVRYRPPASSGGRADDDETDLVIGSVVDAVDELARPSLPEGDVLVFLPGEREIRQVDTALKRDRVDADVLPLFSRLSNQEQDRIFHPSGRRRVILATNIAETSLTVPGIRYVVDSGLARLNRYDPATKVQTLHIEPISRASAEQRAGRCGRVAAGVCIRLYSEDSYRARPAFTDPEIKRANLAGVVLQMKSLSLDPVANFPFLEAPDPAGVADAYETLFELGAIAAPEDAAPLTPVGRAMARVPVDPRIARMLLAAEPEGVLEQVIILAAALSIQDPRERPMNRQEDADRAQLVFRHESSDFLTLLRVWEQYTHAAGARSVGPLAGWCREHFLSPSRMREWAEMAAQLRRVADDLQLRAADGAPSEDAVHRALLTGLISNVGCREGEGGSFDYRTVRARSVQIFPGSVLFKKPPRWIMAAQIVETTRLYARTVARIDPAWIEELAGHMFRHQLSDRHLDAQTGEPSAWERITMSGIVVVPRRRTPIAKVDPRSAREIFIRDGLVRHKWSGDAPFMPHNRGMIDTARSLEAKLRRRDVLASDDELAAWFDSRLPPEVCDPATLNNWLAHAGPGADASLRIPLEAALAPGARTAADPGAYPDELLLGDSHSPVRCPLTYALAPGKDEDGVTATLPLRSLPLLTPERAAWLVPGMLADLVLALIKTLPKPDRAAIEAKGALSETAAAIAGVLQFGSGALAAALSEGAEVLAGVRIDPASWSFAALPAHLRLRIRVVDDHGKELGVDRDLGSLAERLAGRLRRAQAAHARARFDRAGLTTWDFRELPEKIAVEREGAATDAFPALVDDGETVSLTLLFDEPEAAARTLLGLRRLFALAARDDLEHYLDALPQWSEMSRHYAQLGSPELLRREIGALVAERAFLANQAPVRSQAEFEARLAGQRGRLPTLTREVGEVVARILEPRFRIAQRLSGGTPRLWAQSIADVREHAAYLLPPGFLSLLSWERVRQFPRYVEAMRGRLFALREEGSRVETEALARVSPHWKRFTAWVAAAMSAERAGPDALERAEAPRSGPRAKAPLPQARRAAPSVNLDAGRWAMQPGRLPPAVEQYRWALEEFRVAAFGAEAAGGSSVGTEELAAMWKRAEAV